MSLPPSIRPRLPVLLALVCLAAAGPARADSAAALCELLPKGHSQPTAVRACVFSQRQGHIGIQLAGGQRHDFSPQDGGPGRFTDAQGQAVQRQAGLGKRGQQFRLADGSRLRVLWGSGPLKTTLALQGIRFTLASANQGSQNTLVVTPAGLRIDNSPQRQDIDGTVSSAELADLDGDGSPELYVGTTSAGSSSAGQLLGWAVNKRKSLSGVFLPPLDAAAPAAQGYQGHDSFQVEGRHLVQRFPVYKPGDANASPSGGVRSLVYRLVPGEAGWLLQLDRWSDAQKP